MTPDLPVAPPVEPVVSTSIQSGAVVSRPLRVDSHGYHYEIAGNTLLMAEHVRDLLSASSDPKHALADLNQAYQRAGYFMVTLKADVNAQDVSIRVIQGRILEYAATNDLDPYFSSLRGDEAVDRDTVMTRAARAETYAARQGVRPKLKFAPASTVGGSRLDVTEEPIPDSKSWDMNLGFGNYGNRYSSRFLGQSSAAWRPGAGLEFSANFTHAFPALSDETHGSRYNGGGASTSIVTPYGQYALSFSRTLYQLGDVSNPLNNYGDIRQWSFVGSNLLLADEHSRWAINAGFTHTDYTVKVFDGLYTLVDQKYDFLTLGTSYARSFHFFDKPATISLSVNASRGISDREGTFVYEFSGAPAPDFTLWQWSVGYSQDLWGGARAGLTLTGQHADATLPYNQQWVLGGFASLSAWYPGVLVGDSGQLLRASVSGPDWSVGSFTFTPGVFVETGAASYHYTAPNQAQWHGLSDVGLSVSGKSRFGTTLTFAVAKPIAYHNLDESQVNDERVRLYFVLGQAF